MRKILTIFGTRPETIKVAPVIRALQTDPRFESITVWTGQHKEMVTPLLDFFQITPNYVLKVMEPGQPLAKLSGKLLTGLHDIIEAEQPDTVIVQGDTTSAALGALAAYYGYDYTIRTEGQARRRINIAHIEAGLRTGDIYAPFPEELNRKLISQVATYHFAPTQTAADALAAENIGQNVYITGNTVIDALHYTAAQKPHSPINLAEGSRMILITGHRRENYGAGFENICYAIQKLAAIYPHDTFVYPVHLNKHVQDPVRETLSNIPNVHLIPPQDYPQFVALMQQSYLILTDSGGLQEEAPALGKPLLLMRESTERPEAITAGTVKLVGTDPTRIITSVRELLSNPSVYAKMAQAINPFGDGKATPRILNLLAHEAPAENQFKVAA